MGLTKAVRLLVVLVALVVVAQEGRERVVLVIHQALLQAKEIMVGQVQKTLIIPAGVEAALVQ